MDVKINSIPRFAAFGDLNNGDVFENEGRYYMKIVDSSDRYNAVLLTGKYPGYSFHFNDVSGVQPVSATLVVGRLCDE